MFEEEKSLFEKASADQDAVRVFIISWLVGGELCSRKESSAYQDAVGMCMISWLVRGETLFEERKLCSSGRSWGVHY